jgi:hypothetical protein
MAENEISRRRMLKRVGAGAAVAWTAPVLTSIRTPAFAQSGACPNGCADILCFTEEQFKCNDDATCICTRTTENDCFCGDGRCSCDSYSACRSSADCPSGQKCACCAVPRTFAVCRPVALARTPRSRVPSEAVAGSTPYEPIEARGRGHPPPLVTRHASRVTRGRVKAMGFLRRRSRLEVSARRAGGQGKRKYRFLATLNISCTGPLQQDPGRAAVSPAETRTYRNGSRRPGLRGSGE